MIKMIHPNAIANYNEKAEQLAYTPLELTASTSQSISAKKNADDRIALSIQPDMVISPTTFRHDIPSANSITKTIIRDNEVRYGRIEEADHFRNLAEDIQRLNSLRDKVNSNYVETQLFEWLHDRHVNGNMEPFLDLLLRNIAKDVEQFTLYVPVANTRIEQPFEFCNVIFCEFSRSLVDEIERNIHARTLGKDISNGDAIFSQVRKKYQGYAAIKLKLICDKNYAEELAIKKAYEALRYLAIFNPAMRIPNINSRSLISGMTHLPEYTIISHNDNNSFSYTTSVVEPKNMHPWYITISDLKAFRDYGLDSLSKLVSKHKRTNFEESLMTSLSIYSKVAFTDDPLDKLVVALSALESLLLKDTSEPIQSTLSDRLAYWLEKDSKDRRAIISNVKSVYRIRSNYLHHGNTRHDLELLTAFLAHANLFFVSLLRTKNVFATKDDFLSKIDDIKYA